MGQILQEEGKKAILEGTGTQAVDHRPEEVEKW